MKLHVLGTGNAFVTEVYNTCFVLENENGKLLVDGGGGSYILKRLKDANISYTDIHEIFVTHKHVDHILGIIWMIRVIATAINKGQYEGNLVIYAHDEVIHILKEISNMLLQKKEVKHFGDRIILFEVVDKQEINLIGKKTVVFDIHSTKAKQFGFVINYKEGKKLTCCGDEPLNENDYEYAKNSDWMLHEAFCLFSQADIYKPYEKQHSTAKDASILANELNVKNLILYHTEDNNIKDRKILYSNEAKKYFSSNVYVPNDLEVIEID